MPSIEIRELRETTKGYDFASPQLGSKTIHNLYQQWNQSETDCPRSNPLYMKDRTVVLEVSIRNW